MKTVDIVERIEGEAKLVCSWKDNKIDNARIEFLNFRGFEYILEGKAALDALIYTPRICGICGQAHLKASVEALENVYKTLGYSLELSNKAKLLREIGLNIEIIDSHIKWFYMFIMPDIVSLSNKNYDEYKPLKGKKWLRGSAIASEIIKSLAIIGGQWPHTSYMVPGGVVSDPTLLDLTTMQNYLDSAINFFQEDFAGVDFDEFLSFSSLEDLEKLGCDLKDFVSLCFEHDLEKLGKSHNCFITLGESSLFKQGKYKKRIVHNIDSELISENTDYTFNVKEEMNSKTAYGWAKSVTYAESFYETGPLARALISNRAFIKAVHKEFDDSVLTRVLARMDEFVHLINKTKELIKKIDLSEESYIKPTLSLSNIDYGKGQSFVEASRGSLFHDIEIENGVFTKYDVITPTVWNLGPGIEENLSIAQKAIIGNTSIEKAQIILRSFDVCSVCTTH